jgi:hypothetical protein
MIISLQNLTNMTPTSACLDATLHLHENKDVNENQDTINQEVENFKSFYRQCGVPDGKIFLSGAISARKLIELCQGVDFLHVQLAKGSPDLDDVSDFKFIISQLEDDEETASTYGSKQTAPPDDDLKNTLPVLENVRAFMPRGAEAGFAAMGTSSAKFMSTACCKNPPGN